MSAPEKKTKKRRTLTLRKVLLIDLVLLLLVAVGLSVLEVRITERKQKENLAARLNKISSALTQSFEETKTVTELYDADFETKVKSIAYVLERYPDTVINKTVKDFCRADALVVGDPVTPPENDTARYYSAAVPDGPTVTIRKDSAELDNILNSVYTENSILKQVTASGDLFFMVTREDGEIAYYSDEAFIGENIREAGIPEEVLTGQEAGWVVVNPLHLIQRIRWSFQSLWAPDFPAADTAGCTDIYSEELYIPSSPNNSRTL